MPLSLAGRILYLYIDEEDNLKAPHVRQLIDRRIVTVDQAIKLTIDQRNALADTTVRQKLMNGILDSNLANTPNITEIIKTAKSEKSSRREIRKNALVLYQSHKGTGFFARLPEEQIT